MYDEFRLSRRQVLVGGMSFGAMALVGCGTASVDTPNAPGDDQDTDPDPDPDPDPNPGPIVPGEVEISSQLWQVMAPYARANTDGSIGTRINLFNSTPVSQRILVQVFTPSGELVVKENVADALPSGRSRHIELGELLTDWRLPLPFEGSVWVGTTPVSGSIIMGIQGIVFDWYGPAQMASVHAMSDFGNSNGDAMWSDMILPKVIATDRYVSRIAILNGSGDGTSEALIANPEIVIRDDDGQEVTRATIDPLPRFASTLVDVRDLLGGSLMQSGSIQITEPYAGLVAMGFVVDTNNDGINTADHLFDRHFVTGSTGFVND